jgi:hypothetical protein
MLLPKKYPQSTRSWQGLLSDVPVEFRRANQFGWTLNANLSFGVFWNGGENLVDTEVQSINDESISFIKIKENGVIAFDIDLTKMERLESNYFWLGPAANYFIDGMTPITQIFSAEQCSAPLQLQLKVTRHDSWIFVKKGHPLAGVMELNVQENL